MEKTLLEEENNFNSVTQIPLAPLQPLINVCTLGGKVKQVQKYNPKPSVSCHYANQDGADITHKGETQLLYGA